MLELFKQCTRCKKELPNTPDYFAPQNRCCRKCLNEKRREQYYTDPEGSKKEARDWYHANIDKGREIGRRSRRNNSERAKQNSLDWAKQNPDKVKEIKKRERIKNAQKYRDVQDGAAI